MAFLYLHSLDNARREDEVMLWRDSFKENIRCKHAIEKAISENFNGVHLKDGIVARLADEFGTDRLTWVLANTVKENLDDGRFRPENKQWAKEIYIPKDSRNYEFAVSSHPEIVNGLITEYRQYLADVIHQYSMKDCIPGSGHARASERQKDYLVRVRSIIPPSLNHVHPKAAIKERNRWMVENCNLLIAYVTHDHGGAATALRMAEKQGVEVFRI